MGILDELAELDKLAGEEQPQEQEEVAADEPEVVETPETPEPEAVETPPAPVLPAIKTELEAAPEGGWARARWELAEERRKREALEAKLAAMSVPAVPAKEESYEAHVDHRLDANTATLEELKAWKREQEAKVERETLERGAAQEFMSYENSFKQQLAAYPDAPPYEEVAEFAWRTIASGLAVVNPHLSNDEIKVMADKEILRRGAIAYNNGKNPAAAIYEEAINRFGYRPQPKEAPVATTALPAHKPSNLKTIAANKQKSANMAATGSGSGSGSEYSPSRLDSMSNAERARLTPDDWAKFEREHNSRA
jgi:hypothetical protein